MTALYINPYTPSIKQAGYQYRARLTPKYNIRYNVFNPNIIQLRRHINRKLMLTNQKKIIHNKAKSQDVNSDISTYLNIRKKPKYECIATYSPIPSVQKRRVYASIDTRPSCMSIDAGSIDSNKSIRKSEGNIKYSSVIRNTINDGYKRYEKNNDFIKRYNASKHSLLKILQCMSKQYSKENI